MNSNKISVEILRCMELVVKNVGLINMSVLQYQGGVFVLGLVLGENRINLGYVFDLILINRIPYNYS